MTRRNLTMKVKESEEMYLETLLLLSKEKSNVHAVDVCEALGYARSSVSRGMSLLKQKGYITVDAYEVITLTSEGRKKAEGVYERHRVLTSLFEKIGADSATAEEDACRIEHVISEKLFLSIKKYLEEN